jgi:hypothetical protein
VLQDVSIANRRAAQIQLWVRRTSHAGRGGRRGAIRRITAERRRLVAHCVVSGTTGHEPQLPGVMPPVSGPGDAHDGMLTSTKKHAVMVNERKGNLSLTARLEQRKGNQVPPIECGPWLAVIVSFLLLR